jgi:hypothetical protein
MIRPAPGSPPVGPPAPHLSEGVATDSYRATEVSGQITSHQQGGGGSCLSLLCKDF